MPKATKKEVAKERSTSKVKSVLKDKGYKSGKTPKGKVLHHVKPVIKGGKTTAKNTRVITATSHKKIHQNRRKSGKI